MNLDLKAFIPAVFGTVSITLAIVIVAYCEFVSFESTNGAEVRFGIWKYQWFKVSTDNGVNVYNTCNEYPVGVSFDSPWNASKAFSIIAPVIGGFCLFFAWLAPCIYPSQRAWKSIGSAFVLSTLFQGLVLLYLNGNGFRGNELLSGFTELEFDSTCSLAWGANCCIAATVCWFVAGVAVCVLPAPVRPPRPPPQTQEVTYTKTTQPDGTQVVTEKVAKGTYVPDSGAV